MSRPSSLGPRLAAALRTLAADDRDTLLLYAWAGLTYEEVALATGVAVGTVRSRIHRARTRVRAHLESRPRGGHVTDFDDLDWLAAEQPATEPPDELATQRARTALLVHARTDGRPVPAPRPAAPPRRARERRWLRPSRVLALAGAAAVAAFAATSVPVATGVPGSLGGSRLEEATGRAARAPVRARRPGAGARGQRDARPPRPPFPDRQGFRGFDLYVDDGRYYYGATMAELRAGDPQELRPGQRDGPRGRGGSAGRRAARRAADRDAMITATWAENTNPPDEPQLQDDNRVWIGCMDALLAGAGRPDVRSGVLFLLSTMSAVTTEEQTRDGRRVLALANAGFLDESSAESQKAFPGGYVETLYVDAESGIPVGFTGGVPGQEPSVTMTYDIERTTPARVRQGYTPDVTDVSPPASGECHGVHSRPVG